MFEKIDSYAADKRRLGAVEANNRNRTALPTQRATRNLERVELDHMLIDILLIDDRTGLVLGRPWLTVAIDCNSRLIVGLHLSFDNPCATSVLQCIKSGILPKDSLLARFPNLTVPWPAYGIWHRLVLDNGMEMHSKRLQTAALELGISLAYCPSRKPWYKGHVERFNRTLNDGLIHSLPGTTFSNPQQRAGYPSKDKSCLSFRAFERIPTARCVAAHSNAGRRVRRSPLMYCLLFRRNSNCSQPASRTSRCSTMAWTWTTSDTTRLPCKMLRAG
jgi:putative transposase